MWSVSVSVGFSLKCCDKISATRDYLPEESKLKCGVGTIAERLPIAVLAAAKVQSSVLFRVVAHGCELAVPVRTIAKGLALAFSAGAPEILFASFDLYWKRCFLGDVGCCHGASLFEIWVLPFTVECPLCPAGSYLGKLPIFS
jgi:hypothetical protein